MKRQNQKSKMLLDDFLERLEKNKEERLFVCEESLMFFSLIYFSKYHHFSMPDFHFGMYEDLKFEDIIGALWIMFRESAKSSLAKIKIIHNICYQQKRFNIWTSFDQKKAESNLFDITLELQTNKRLIADFGQLFYGNNNEKKSQKRSIKEFVTTNNCKVKAYSTGQSPRGEVFGEFRPDFLVLDDIETIKTIISEPRTKQVIDYIDELFSGMSGDMNLLILGNRLADNGSISYIENKIKNDPKFRVRDVKIIENNEITWPQKFVFTDEEAEKINKNITDSKKQVISLETKELLLGETVFNREMMNTPLSDNEREIKFSWLQNYYNEQDLQAKSVNRYITIDVADSKEREERKSRGEPDYTGIAVVDWDIENFWYVKYAKRERLNSPELIDKIFWLWQTFNPIKIGVEKKSFLDQIKPYITIKSEETGIYPVVVELEHGGNRKEDRIRGVIQGRLQAGKIRFLRDAKDDTDKLRYELYDFPRGKFDDLADALAYIEQIGVRPFVKNKSTIMPEIHREFYEERRKEKKNNLDFLEI